MKTIRLVGEVDHEHRLSAQVPAEVPPGRVALTIVVPAESGGVGDDAEGSEQWMKGISDAWARELGDAREDIYTLDDGEPVDGRR